MAGNLNYDRIMSILNRLLSGKINVKKEFFIFKKLFNKYPDWDYWNNLLPDKTTNSLAWYLSEWGNPYLKKQWMNHVKSRESVNIPQNKISPPEIIEKNLVDQKKNKCDTKKSIIQLLDN